MTELYKTAAHEAGHAIAFMACGIAVKRLVANESEGGLCEGDIDLDFLEAESAAKIAVAGPAAVQALTGQRDELSGEDVQMATWHSGPLPRSQRLALETWADRWTWEHKAELRFLADALHGRGVLLKADLGNLCRQPRSPLSIYAGLYPDAPSLAGDVMHNRILQAIDSMGTERREMNDQPKVVAALKEYPARGAGTCSYVSKFGPAPESPTVPGLEWIGSAWTWAEKRKPARRPAAAYRTLDLRA